MEMVEAFAEQNPTEMRESAREVAIVIAEALVEHGESIPEGAMFLDIGQSTWESVGSLLGAVNMCFGAFNLTYALSDNGFAMPVEVEDYHTASAAAPDLHLGL